MLTAIAVAIFVYIIVAWRKAPRASRAMKWIAAASLTTGILMGAVSDHILSGLAAGLRIFPHNNPCSPDGLLASEIGRAIILTNQQHAGDPNWVDPMTIGSYCPSETYSSTDRVCEVYFLASHSLGYNLSKGETRKCIPNEDVAELCTGADIAKDSYWCHQAFDLQQQKLAQ
jgi:hypothetical protein